ncbi:MAG: CcmD family protein [Sphingobacteriaceae bacterium]|jgi:CcmD family protein|nr:MAG: CcmD family protein [Pedobacter sp.]
MKRILFFLLLLILFTIQSKAQTSTGVEMADILRSSGKIYVVVAVIGVIFTGIVIYLFTIDRKLTKLENEQLHQKQN